MGHVEHKPKAARSGLTDLDKQIFNEMRSYFDHQRLSAFQRKISEDMRLIVKSTSKDEILQVVGQVIDEAIVESIMGS
jgi:ribosomal protein L18